MPSRMKRLLLTLTVAGATAFAAPAAHAGLLVADAQSCQAQSLSQPFLPWADPASYTLQPGGDFEPGSPAWDLTGGADSATVNEPWNVTDEMDGHSLLLTSGSSATSPSLCVGLVHPDVRFFTRASSGTAVLKVEVLYLDASGQTQSLTIGVVSGNGAWSPTAPMPIVVNLLPLLPDGRTPVAFRLTALSGSWKVDDFYVDPYARY